jgi:hypothetical protein
MRPSYVRARAFLVLVILVQLWLLLYPRMGPEPYRLEERMRAFRYWKQVGTPEAKAAFDGECAAEDRHVRLRSTLYFGSFFLINGLLCYFFWNYGKRAVTGPQLKATTFPPST